MVQDLSEQESARRMLRAFIGLSRRRGAVVRITRLRRRFNQAGPDAAAFQAGINFAMARGWIEPSLAASYRLTDHGFDEALTALADTTGGLPR